MCFTSSMNILLSSPPPLEYAPMISASRKQILFQISDHMNLTMRPISPKSMFHFLIYLDLGPTMCYFDSKYVTLKHLQFEAR